MRKTKISKERKKDLLACPRATTQERTVQLGALFAAQLNGSMHAAKRSLHNRSHQHLPKRSLHTLHDSDKKKKRGASGDSTTARRETSQLSPCDTTGHSFTTGRPALYLRMALQHYIFHCENTCLVSKKIVSKMIFPK